MVDILDVEYTCRRKWIVHAPEGSEFQRREKSHILGGRPAQPSVLFAT